MKWLFVPEFSVLQILFAGGVTFILLNLINGVFKFWKFHKYFNAIPGDTDFHWIFGNMQKYSTAEKINPYVTALTRKYPILYRNWRTPLIPVIICVHPESVKTILKSSEPKPRRYGTPYLYGLPWLGEGLLMSNGQKWARNRKLLTAAFHFDILQPYIRVENEAADILLNKIENQAKEKKSFEIFEYISSCALDILLRCAFSYTDDIQGAGANHPYTKVIAELKDAWLRRMVNPLVYPDFIYYLTPGGRKFSQNCKYVHNFAEEIIAKRRQELEDKSAGRKQESKYLDFLDILLEARDENNEGLSQLEIRNEADTFLFEGHDTTTSALSLIIYSLATHQEYQRKIQEELDQICTGKKDKYITMNDIQKMEYMTMCIKEGLRLHSPVPFIERLLTQEMEISGYKIPAGTSVAVQIFCLHGNSLVWEDPDMYRPDRFLPENVKNREPFAFVPFSAGSRNCIGQNFAMHTMKVLLARILQKYTLELDESIPVRIKPTVVMKTENGVHVFAKPRNSTDH